MVAAAAVAAAWGAGGGDGGGGGGGGGDGSGLDDVGLVAVVVRRRGRGVVGVARVVQPSASQLLFELHTQNTGNV